MKPLKDLIKEIWTNYDDSIKEERLLQLTELEIKNQKEKNNSITSNKIKKLIKDLRKNKEIEDIENKLRELGIKSQDLHKLSNDKLTEIKTNLNSKLRELLDRNLNSSTEQKNNIKPLLNRKNDNLLYVAAYQNIFSPRILDKFMEKFSDYDLEKKINYYTKEGILHYIIKLDDAQAFKKLIIYYNDNKKSIYFIIKEHLIRHLIEDSIRNQYNIFYYATEIGSTKIVEYFLKLKSNTTPKNEKEAKYISTEYNILKNFIIEDLTKIYPNALDIAIQNGNLDIVKNILSSTDYAKYISIHTESIYIAAHKGFTEILKIIEIKKQHITLDHKINSLVMCLIAHFLNKKKEISENIFKEAANQDDTRAIEGIMKLYGIKPNRVPPITKCKDNQQNLLHYAVLEGNLKIIEALSKNHTALIVDKNINGDTPLHLCNSLLSKSHIKLETVLEIIQTLCKKRPEALHMQNLKGESPFRLFKSNHRIVNAICRERKKERPNNSKTKQKVYIRLHEVSEEIINTQSLITGRILSLATAFTILSYFIKINITSKLEKRKYITGCTALVLSLTIIAINSYLMEKKRRCNLLKEYNLLITIIQGEEKNETNTLYQLFKRKNDEICKSSFELLLLDYGTTNKICSAITEPTDLSHEEDKEIYRRLSKVSKQLTTNKKIATVRILSLSIALITLAYLIIKITSKRQKTDYILGCVVLASSLVIITIDSHLVKKNREHNLSEEYEFLTNRIAAEKEDAPSTSFKGYYTLTTNFQRVSKSK